MKKIITIFAIFFGLQTSGNVIADDHDGGRVAVVALYTRMYVPWMRRRRGGARWREGHGSVGLCPTLVGGI